MNEIIQDANLLDREEINQIIAEIETLPYAKEVEAIEYGHPAIYINGSLLLYILSVPKVCKEEFNQVIVRSAIENWQIDLQFERMLVNHRRTFGITEYCLAISNSTICETKALKEILEEECVAKLLKGGHAYCTYRTNNEEIIELIKPDTIFVTTFIDTLDANGANKLLSGTYVIQMNDETIELKEKTFSIRKVTNLQVLPPMMTNISRQGHKVDVGYVHELSLKNIAYLGNLSRRLKISTIMEIGIFSALGVVSLFIWRKLNSKIKIPAIYIQHTSAE